MPDYALSELTEKTALVKTDLMHIRTVGNIDQRMTVDNFLITSKNPLSKSSDYVITDADVNPIIFMTTGAVDKTITLPTLADNIGSIIKVINIDSGAGSLILDGEGAETINGFATWEITEQWGYVEVIAIATGWIVLSQWGCIYEIWDSTGYQLTTSWVDFYNLPGLTAGNYFIEFCGTILALAGIFGYITIATAVDVEDDAMYTMTVKGSTGGTDTVTITKSFYRAFSGTTTLYLNGKESGSDAALLNDQGAEGFIRATRVS